MTDAVIERMARAMWDQDHSEDLGDEGWAEAEHDTKASYLGSATAALAALKPGDWVGNGVGESYFVVSDCGWPEMQRQAAEAMRGACAAVALNWPTGTPAFNVRTPQMQIAAAIRKLTLPK